jgi:hypothetical protein
MSPRRLCGRDAGYPAPPAQTPACSFPAPGSSVVLASARTFTVARYKAQWLFPSVRLARVVPILRVRHEFPLRAAYSRGVLRHVAGFPDLGLLCPIRHPIGMRLSPACLTAPYSKIPPESTPFLGSSPHCVPTPTASPSHFAQEPLGLPGFSDVSLPACHGLRTPADLHTLALSGASVLPSVYVKTLGVRNKLFRSCTSTSGSAVSPTACRMLCVRLPRFLFAACAAPQRDQHSIRVGG